MVNNLPLPSPSISSHFLPTQLPTINLKEQPKTAHDLRRQQPHRCYKSQSPTCCSISHRNLTQLSIVSLGFLSSAWYGKVTCRRFSALVWCVRIGCTCHGLSRHQTTNPLFSYNLQATQTRGYTRRHSHAGDGWKAHFLNFSISSLRAHKACFSGPRRLGRSRPPKLLRLQVSGFCRLSRILPPSGGPAHAQHAGKMSRSWTGEAGFGGGGRWI